MLGGNRRVIAGAGVGASARGASETSTNGNAVPSALSTEVSENEGEWIAIAFKLELRKWKPQTSQ